MTRGLNMTRGERFLRGYSHGDWIARLVLTTCFAATLNFVEIFSYTMAAAAAAGPHVVDGYVVISCYFGPPAAFYPRLLVLAGLLLAAPAAFPRTSLSRLICSTGLTISLCTFIYWWLDSYRIFRHLNDAEIRFLDNVEIKQSAYLYGATFLDLGVALSLTVCLVAVLDRLFDGEKEAKMPDAIFESGTAQSR